VSCGLLTRRGQKKPEPSRPTCILQLPKLLGPEDVDHVLKALLLVNPLMLPDLLCRKSILNWNTPEYNFITGRIQMLCETTLRTRMTRNDEGFTAQKNILKNLRHYIANRASNDWEGRLAEMPMAVIGSGPSLDVSVEKLAKEGKKLIVLTAESAQRMGRVPDTRRMWIKIYPKGNGTIRQVSMQVSPATIKNKSRHGSFRNWSNCTN
jgi:hypothetical protein